MAARTRRPLHDEATRKKIQTSQLINRLQSNALGKLKEELSAGRVKSIEILLRKVVPDLATLAHTGAEGDDLKIVHEIRPQVTRDEWLKLHGK